MCIGTSSKSQSHHAPPLAKSANPTLAAITYLTFSTALTLANKYVFSSANFNHPWTTLSIQSSAVVSALSLYQLLRNAITFSPSLLQESLLPCLLFTSYLFTNARALRHLSLPMLAVLKSLAPIGIAIAERLLFRDAISKPVASAMLLVIFANIIALFNAPPAPATAYAWAILNVAVNIAHVLSLRVCLSSHFSPVEKTLHANLLATLFMLPIASYNREVIPFFHHMQHATWIFRAVFALSCVLAALIGASIFWLVQLTSGSTLSFVGSCNKFPIVVLGAVLFHSPISLVGWISVSFGVLAGILFAVAKAYEKSGHALSDWSLFRVGYPHAKLCPDLDGDADSIRIIPR